MRQLIEHIRSMPPAGQRRLALIISVATSLLAAGAIYALHRTMPDMGGGATVHSGRAPSGWERTPAGAPTIGGQAVQGTQAPDAAPPAAAEPRESTDSQEAVSPPAAQDTGTTTGAGIERLPGAGIERLPGAGAPAAGGIPAPEGSAPGVGPAHMRESGAPVSLRVPMPEHTPRTSEERVQPAVDASRRDRAAAPGATASRTPVPVPPRGRTPEKSGTASQSTAQESPASAPSAQRTTEPGPAPQPSVAAPRPPQRLAAQQQAQCAGSTFIERFICDERVRLRFCRDRWNEHPDCNVETPRNNNY